MTDAVPAPLDAELVARLCDAVAANLAALQARIDAVNRPTTGPVEIVAVTKGHGPESVAACLANGLTLIGENYADELVAKARHPELAVARWTFQGRLQTNKINRLRPFVSLWQTVDSDERIAGLAQRVPGACVLVQLNLTGAEGRGGAAPDDGERLVDVARLAGLDVRGVMGIGPDPDEPGWKRAQSVDAFRIAVELADRCELPVRSLGMTSDLEEALEAGATMVRVGTALVGARR